MNAQIFDVDDGDPPIRESEIKSPASLLLLCDGDAPNSCFLVTGDGNPAREVSGRHSGGANVLFVDGYIKWYDKDDILADTNMWNN